MRAYVRLRRNLGGQLKTGNLWTPQNRQFPGAAETSEFYFVPASLQIGLQFRAPAPWPAFEHVRVVQQSIEQGGDGGGVAEQLAPVVQRSI